MISVTWIIDRGINSWRHHWPTLHPSSMVPKQGVKSVRSNGRPRRLIQPAAMISAAHVLEREHHPPTSLGYTRTNLLDNESKVTIREAVLLLLLWQSAELHHRPRLEPIKQLRLLCLYLIRQGRTANPNVFHNYPHGLRSLLRKQTNTKKQ